jgi:hypothetical protein
VLEEERMPFSVTKTSMREAVALKSPAEYKEPAVAALPVQEARGGGHAAGAEHHQRILQRALCRRGRCLGCGSVPNDDEMLRKKGNTGV